MDSVKRQQLVDRYKDGYRVVAESLAGATDAELDAHPAPGKWSAREIVHHLSDSEMTSAIRLRLLIAAPRPAINGYDEAEFARRLYYDRPIDAWQILALNTEKAHNLKEKSLEVIRIYRGLLEEDGSRPEKSFSFYLEEASFVTLGLCYEKLPRFSGGAYNSIVRRLSGFSDESLNKSVKAREKHAEQLMDLDSRVAEVIAKLKAKGFLSPYLRAFVVGRINPLRWMQGEPPPLEEVFKTMRERVGKFNVDKIKQEDLASTGGSADDAD